VKRKSGKTALPIIAILLLALAERLPYFNAPPVSWRQADNAAVSRNYFEGGMRFLRPQVDWSGTGTGVVQMEFPLYQYSVAILYKVFGVHEVLGRVVSIAASLATIWVMFLLVRGMMGPVAGLWAALALAVFPQYASLSRAFRVEAPVLLCCALAVYSFRGWLDGRGRRWYWVFAASASLAGLMKIIALIHLAFPLVFLVLLKKRALFRPQLWASVALVLASVMAWYAWSGVLLREGGNSFFGDWSYGSDKWGNWRLAVSWKFWNLIVFQRVAEKHITWVGFAVLLLGLFSRVRRPAERVFDWWLAGCLVYSAVVSPGSRVHEHYQVPFVLAAAAVMARGFVRLPRRPRWLVPLAAAAFVAVGVVRGYFETRDEHRTMADICRLAPILEARTSPGDLVIALDEGHPGLLYLSHRKGWVAGLDGFRDGAIRREIAAGARWLAGRYGDPKHPDKVREMKGYIRDYRVEYDDGKVFIAGAEGAGAR